MPFKILAVTATLLAGCGSSIVWHDWGGEYGSGYPTPISQNAISNWTGDGANLLVTVERHGKTFSLFHLDPFDLVQTQSLPLPEAAELVFPSIDGQYFLAVSGGNYAIVKADGTVNLNPLAMTGLPQTAAYSPTAHTAVLTDDSQSMMLLHMDATGAVLGSWKTSTKFPNDQYLLSGAMLADGTYAAALSGSSVTIVDVAASITAQSWQVRTFDVAGASNMTWTATIPGLGYNAVLVQDSNRLVVINTDSGTVVDQKSLGSAAILGYFNDLTPHVISQTKSELAAQNNDVTFVSSTGKLSSTTFQGSSEEISSSWLDPTAGFVAIEYNRHVHINAGTDAYRSYRRDGRIIARFHTSDGSAFDISTVDHELRLMLRSNFIFGMYPSSIGMAVRLTYGTTPIVQTVNKYALPVIVKRFDKK